MIESVFFEPLALSHTDELALLFLNEPVYRYIGGQPPSREQFSQGMCRAMAGPPPSRAADEWVNYAVRRVSDNVLLGRLEATVHDGIAEVAFLFGQHYWGMGYATEGLLWLHRQLHARPSPPALWATTVPENHRCQALLRRCGYSVATDQRPSRLVTYDDGDLVFRGPSAV
ncbi:MAG: hypothetical protein RJA70_3093 [Pseudomonadota bacterium]|jgi:RimJ/RimL family protein N-acetyltransferase